MTARQQVLTERVDIEVADGSSMTAYVARPSKTETLRGVLVGSELFGLSAHVRDVCERLAEHGFVAVAPDFYHRTAPGIEIAHDALGRERGFELLKEMTRAEVLHDVRATFEYLRVRGSGRIGMVGMSVGGHIAYLAASEIDLAAVAVLYGGWIPTTDISIGRPEATLTKTSDITGRMLFLVGENDHVVPSVDRRAIETALRASHVRHEFVEYPGAAHGFFCDRRDTFEPAAAQDAWRRIEDLFQAEL